MIGSCLMMSLKGPHLLKEEKDFIISNRIAGVLLFKRNLQSFQQIYELCSELKTLTKPPLLIAVDMEGGEVDRLSHLKESTPWPSAAKLQTLKVEQIYLIAQSMARQLYLLGIDINFAPVVDLLLVHSPLLNTRVFGKSKEDILKKTEPFIQGMKKEGIIVCLKHFPGHGGVSYDSHKTLPEDQRSIESLKPQLEIFKTLFKKHPCWIMTAHIEFSNIEKTPATFSKTLLTDLLKTQMGFEGIVVSDDIDMAALKKISTGERFFYALKGGCDLALTGQNSKSPKEIINYFNNQPEQKEKIKKTIYKSSKKILTVQQKCIRTFPKFKLVEKELTKIQSAKGLLFSDRV